MIPVLALRDVQAGSDALLRLGFVPVGDGRMRFGSQVIAVVSAGSAPDTMVPLALDHVAFAVRDADSVFRAMSARGAVLDRRFTPDGPRDIPQFWENGVRFVFFEGPEKAPFEFCAVNGKSGSADDHQHDHFGIRTVNMGKTLDMLGSLGAQPIRRYQLSEGASCVAVEFLAFRGCILEVFDERAPPGLPEVHGWIGLLPE